MKMKKRRLAKSIFTALVFSFVFHIVIPIGLVLILNIALSAMTVLDPLHAKKHLEVLWKGFVAIVIFQIVFSVFVSLSVGVSSGLLLEKIKSGWVYLAAAASSFFLHYVLTGVLSGGLYLATNEEIFSAYIVLFLIFVTVIAPFAGISCIAFIRRQAKSNFEKT